MVRPGVGKMVAVVVPEVVPQAVRAEQMAAMEPRLDMALLELAKELLLENSGRQMVACMRPVVMAIKPIPRWLTVAMEQTEDRQMTRLPRKILEHLASW